MTTANLSYTTGTLLTWSNQSNLWSDQFVQLRSWEVAYDILNYTMAIGETVNVVGPCANTPHLRPSETLPFSELGSRGGLLQKSETFAIGEANAKTVTRTSNESLTIGEATDRSASI